MDAQRGENLPVSVLPHLEPTADDEFDLLAYWRVLRERRSLAVTIFGLTVFAGVVLTFIATPRYAVTTTLKIERQAPEILTYQDVLSVDPMAYQDFYQTQYKIIESRAVLRRAVERLDLLNDPRFLARKGSGLHRASRWVRAQVSSGSEQSPESKMNRAIEFVEDNLIVKPLRNSHLVHIGFLDRDAELARDTVEAVSEAYQAFTLEARYTTTEQASEFLTKEVARTQSEVSKLEKQLQAYGAERELLSLSDNAQDISEQALTGLNHDLTEARGRLALAGARIEALNETPSSSMRELLDNALINDLKQAYAELEREHSSAARRFKPDWPERAALQAQLQQARTRLDFEVEDLARQIRQVAQAEHLSTLATVRNLQQEVESQKRVVQRVNRDTLEYTSLKTEIETRRKVLAELVARQSQTETSGQLRDAGASNIRVVDHAEVPERAARPRKLFNLMVSAMLGVFLGGATVFTLHYVDNTIKTERDIERYAPGMPVLGNVPLAPATNGTGPSAADSAGCSRDVDLACHTAPRTLFAEAFRNLRTSLLLASADHPPHRILVTSCEPSDGKSVVSLNLAIVLTQLGRRVLLVDADLRRPRLHRALRLPNKRGLSSLLTGNAELDDTIEDTMLAGLSVISSGPIPPNPSELLGTQVFEAFLSRVDATGRFDHIVVDSPPTVQVADSVLLASHMDATILVARSGVTPRESLIRAASRLRHGRARVAGAVLNVVSESTGYYYRQYAYYGTRENERPDVEPDVPPHIADQPQQEDHRHVV